MASEFNFACSLSNPFIRQEVRDNCNEIRWTSPLAAEIVRYFLLPDQRILPSRSEVRAYFSNLEIDDRPLTDEEIEKVVRICHEFQLVAERSAIDREIDEFFRFYHRKAVTHVLHAAQGNPELIIDGIKSLRYRQTSKIPLVGMGDLDVNEVMRKELGDSNDRYYPSGLSCIRMSNPYGGYQRGEVVEFCGPPSCLTGDTKILTLDRGCKTIEEMYINKEENISVYSYDTSNNCPRVSVAERVVLTKHVIELAEIRIGSATIRSTTDHRFLMADGTYKEAKDLQAGDSLMPITRGLSTSSGYYKEEREYVYSHDKWLW